MNLAFIIAQRSHSPRTKVGSVIVTSDNHCVLSLGYNGIESGSELNEPDSLLPGEEGTIHSEINSLIKMPYDDVREKKMYLTHSPCKICARAIINATTIKTVIYEIEYRDTTGLEILFKRGVSVVKYQQTQKSLNDTGKKKDQDC